MKGLLLKDVYMMASEVKYLILLAAIVLFLQNDWLFIFFILYASALPITSLAYDEQAKWKNLADMLPFTPQQLVGSKYLLGYILAGGATLVVLASKGIGQGGAWGAGHMMLAGVALCISIVIGAVQFPLMYGIGVEKGRLLFILCTVVSSSLLYSAAGVIEETAFSYGTRFWVKIFLPLAFFTVICSLISFHISIKLYQRTK